MKVFFNYLKELYGFSRRKFISVLLLMIADGLTSGTGIAMLVPLLSITGIVGQNSLNIPLLDNILAGMSGLKTSVQLILTLLVYLLLIVIQSVVSCKLSILNAEIIQGYSKYLRVSLYEKIVNAEWSCFTGQRKSDVTNAFTNEIARIGSGTIFFLRILSQVIVAVFQLSIAFMMSFPLTIFTLVSGLLVLWFMNPTFKESKKLGGSLRLINQELVRQIMEQLDGIKEAKSYGIETAQTGAFSETAEKTRRNLTNFTKLQSKTTMLYNIIAAVVISGLFYSSVVYLKIAPAALLIIIYIFARLWPSFKTLQNNIQNVVAMIPAYSALREMSECLDAHRAKLPVSTASVDWPADAAIRFENVCFRYDDSDGFELKDLNFEIPAQKETAITGRSGAGKSTTIDLLIGLLKPSKGRITVGGQTIDEDTMAQWRREIAYVPQVPFLFNGSIRENLLRYTPGATAEEIREALTLAAASEFVEKLPKGIDTVIGDGGVRLSGGERQRIVLTRALLRKPRYLILDEATSSLDNENEYRIQKAMKSLSGKLTVIIVAHRLSTVRDADNIIVVDGGRITEQGSYTELLQNSESYFSK